MYKINMVFSLQFKNLHNMNKWWGNLHIILHNIVDGITNTWITKPFASESKGFALWVMLVAPSLPHASYLCTGAGFTLYALKE